MIPWSDTSGYNDILMGIKVPERLIPESTRLLSNHRSPHVVYGYVWNSLVV